MAKALDSGHITYKLDGDMDAGSLGGRRSVDTAQSVTGVICPGGELEKNPDQGSDHQPPTLCHWHGSGPLNSASHRYDYGMVQMGGRA
ncbi:MAG: hypothetical protein LUQ22_01110, partial [Methanotrichaceae archaeon]|nr:hypothetical protein [Methanotrichaceae archaeon]